MADTPQTSPSWSTWARQHTVQPTGVLTPRSVPELQRQIQDAAAADTRVKVVGRGRSASAIGQPVGTMLTLEHLTGLVRVDPDNLTATFLAGTTVREANRLLGHYNLAFTNLGRLDEQTLAGAISTGFHGTGLSYGIFATQVAELKPAARRERRGGGHRHPAHLLAPAEPGNFLSGPLRPGRPGHHRGADL